MYLSFLDKEGTNRTMNVKRPLCEKRNMIDPRVNIMWEELFVCPPIVFIIVDPEALQ